MISSKILKSHFLNSNYFTKTFNSYSYSTCSEAVEELSYKFHKILSNHFNLSFDQFNSGFLHKYIDKKYSIYLNGATKVTDIFYEKAILLRKEYLSLLKELRKLIKTDFYFQKFPTFRVHMPDNSSKKYYPYFHSDILFGHPPYEINVFATLNKITNEKDGHGLRLLSLAQSANLFKKYKYNIEKMTKERTDIDKILLKKSKLYKERKKNLLIFDTRCYHSVMPLNKHTRISVDVRLMPRKIFEKNVTIYVGNGRKKVSFKPGHGYDKKSIDNI